MHHAVHADSYEYKCPQINFMKVRICMLDSMLVQMLVSSVFWCVWRQMGGALGGRRSDKHETMSHAL